MAEAISEHKYPNRLKELIEKEISNDQPFKNKMEEFKKKLSLDYVGYDVLKRYVYGTARIPDELASEIAKKCGVTVDWLMCHLNDYDVIAILKALSTVLKLGPKIECNIHDEEKNFSMSAALYIDDKFYSFLLEINRLNYMRECYIDDEAYSRQMDVIFSKFKDYFKEKFNTDEFDMSKALELQDLNFF